MIVHVCSWRPIPALILCLFDLACSSPTSPGAGDELSFELNGQRRVFRSNTEYLTVSIAGTDFSLNASNFASEIGTPSLELRLSGYTGSGIYGLGTNGPGGGHLLIGEVMYHTSPPPRRREPHGFILMQHEDIV
jgi:hypothetical protein